ncbi:MAG: DUF6062 family protein [Oscillospiraceae bacterium]|nr:DUF6062 family protein [Oscillospiraceae bacterium]
MRDDLCTITVSEIFEDNEGCPVCRMRNRLDERFVDYILGPAVMEPDVRIISNERGYCREHLRQMMTRENRLALALLLQTHLDEIGKDIFKHKAKPATPKTAYKAARMIETCFICDRIEKSLQRFVDTIFRLYSTEKEFRQTFASQQYLCLPHFELLTSNAKTAVSKKWRAQFNTECSRLAHNRLADLKEGIEQFISIFNYKTDKTKVDMDRAREAIEQTSVFLCGK